MAEKIRFVTASFRPAQSTQASLPFSLTGTLRSSLSSQPPIARAFQDTEREMRLLHIDAVPRPYELPGHER
jgi:hypothetical protein